MTGSSSSIQEAQASSINCISFQVRKSRGERLTEGTGKLPCRLRKELDTDTLRP